MAKLEIIWDGTAPGLAERRLSLEAFGPAIRALVAAIRRLASDADRSAGAERRGTSSGRLTTDAALVDVQISAITSNSPLHVVTDVVLMDTPRWPLIADLPDVAVERFLYHLHRESNATPSHTSVRGYVQKLPEGLSRQSYIYRSDAGETIKSLELGSVSVTAPDAGPYLVEATGMLIGFTFDGPRSAVTIRTSDTKLFSLSTTAEEVERVLPTRYKQVTVLGVAEGATRPRLLRISQEAFEAAPGPDRAGAVFEMWGPLLDRLAQ